MTNNTLGKTLLEVKTSAEGKKKICLEAFVENIEDLF